MEEKRLRPSEELIEKVIRIALVKSSVRWKHRGNFNRFGVLVQRRVWLGGRKATYRVSGRIFSMLMFIEDRDTPGRPSITVEIYKPGDWEKRIDLLYEFAENFRQKYRDKPDVFSPDVVL